MATTQTGTAAPKSNSSRDLYLFLLLIFLALGVGGVAGALALWPEASLSKLVSYFIVAFSTLGATALSGFVIFSLHGTKTKTAGLLRDIETETHELINEAEKVVGSSRALSNLGITGSSLALASNGAMLIMTVLRTYSEDSKWLPLAWVLTNAALNSATNLYGFAANMVVSARNIDLATLKDDKLNEEKEIDLTALTDKLERLGINPAAVIAENRNRLTTVAEATSTSMAASTGLFSVEETRRRSLSVADSGAGAIPTVDTSEPELSTILSPRASAHSE